MTKRKQGGGDPSQHNPADHSPETDPNSGNGNHSEWIEAAKDAKLLLAYAARNGIDLDADIVTSITRSVAAIRDRSLTPEEEADFWLQFNALSKQVEPVNVSSLRATVDWHGEPVGLRWPGGKGRRKLSLAGLEIRRYRFWAVFALVLLLFTQIYFLIGSAIVENISTLPTKINELKVEIASISPQVVGIQTVLEDSVRTETAFDQAAMDQKRLNLVGDQRELQDRLNASYSVLRSWNRMWHGIFFVATAGFAFAPKDNAEADKSSDIYDRYNVDFQTANFTLKALKLYLLPLLYGLLGGCAYVLRTVSQEIRNSTYSADSRVQYQLRLYLAAVAGMAIGWFLTPENTAAVFSSVPPLAVAFLAGYSVEILFAAMDSFVSAFTKK